MERKDAVPCLSQKDLHEGPVLACFGCLWQSLHTLTHDLLCFALRL